MNAQIKVSVVVQVYNLQEYKYTLVDQKYKLCVLNDVICEVEYQVGGSTGTMWKQYLKNPCGFAFLREVAMQYSTSRKRLIREWIHYCSSSQSAKNKIIFESRQKSCSRFCVLQWDEF